jgi:hypothetical protein
MPQSNIIFKLWEDSQYVHLPNERLASELGPLDASNGATSQNISAMDVLSMLSSIIIHVKFVGIGLFCGSKQP